MAGVSLVGLHGIDADRLGANRHLGESVSIEGLRRLTGDASPKRGRSTCGRPRGTPRTRAAPRSRVERGPADRSTEFRLLRRRPRPRVPVPIVRFMLDDADDLGDGFVMDRIDGETIPRQHPPRRAVRAARPPVWRRSAARSRRRSTRSTPRRFRSSRCRVPPSQIEQYRDDPRHARGAASRVRARPALARTHAPPPARRPHAGARRLPQRQLHRRSRGPPGRARLGARASRRPGRGPRLAVREVVALRQRRSGSSGASARTDELLAAYVAAGGGP